MNEELSPSGESKTNLKQLLLGLSLSLVIALLTLGLLIPVVGGLSILFNTYLALYIILVIYLIIPLLINFLVIKFFNKKDIKKGLRIGYILIIIFLICIIYFFVQSRLGPYYYQKALSTDNADLCSRASSSQRDDCYYTIAFKTLNSSICRKMSDKGAIIASRDGCYSNIAEQISFLSSRAESSNYSNKSTVTEGILIQK